MYRQELHVHTFLYIHTTNLVARVTKMDRTHKATSLDQWSRMITEQFNILHCNCFITFHHLPDLQTHAIECGQNLPNRCAPFSIQDYMLALSKEWMRENMSKNSKNIRQAAWQWSWKIGKTQNFTIITHNITHILVLFFTWYRMSFLIEYNYGR